MAVATAPQPVTPPAAVHRRARLGFLRRPTFVATTVIGLVVAWLALGPIVELVWDTIWDGQSISLSGVGDAYSAFGIGSLFTDSFVFAIGTTVYAVLQGGVLAWLAARTNAPFKTLLFAASIVPLIMPDILSTIAWIYLGSPRTGILNHWSQAILGSSHLNIYSMPGMIFIEGQHLAPLVFLLIYAALRGMDPSLEESALMCGAKRLTVVRRVTIPMAAPAIYASIVIMMVRSLEAFEVPALVGLPHGIIVFTGRIWRALNNYPPDKSTAGSYSILLLIVCTIGMVWYTRLTRRGGRSFQTVTGKGFRAGTMSLGAARWPIGALIVLYFLFCVVLPVFVLLYGSTQTYYRPPTWHTLTHPSLHNYHELFAESSVMSAMRNSVLLAIGTATAVMLVMAIGAWVVIRTKVRGRAMLDILSTLPLGIPGIVLGFSLLSLYLVVPIPVYGTIWILFIAYFTRFMPYGMRYASTSMMQIAAELEESARMSGASWWQTFRRVLLPLMLPGLLAGWIYIVTVSIRELSSSLLLYSPGNEVLSISIWELWSNGRFPVLAALGVVMTLALLVIIVIARRIGSRYGVGEQL